MTLQELLTVFSELSGKDKDLLEADVSMMVEDGSKNQRFVKSSIKGISIETDIKSIKALNGRNKQIILK